MENIEYGYGYLSTFIYNDEYSIYYNFLCLHEKVLKQKCYLKGNGSYIQELIDGGADIYFKFEKCKKRKYKKYKKRK